MSNFKAKMHQIRFRLGLRPRTHWGSKAYSAPSDLLAGFKGSYLESYRLTDRQTYIQTYRHDTTEIIIPRRSAGGQ